MSAFEDFDEAGFLDLEPASKSTRKVELKLAMVKMRSAERLTLTFQPQPLAEIVGPRFDVAWNPTRRLLLVKAGDAARFEATTFMRGEVRRIMCPVPPGLAFAEGSCEPEFYVDAIGRRILIEVPVEFGRRLALPAPSPAPASPSAEVRGGEPFRPAVQIPASAVETGNREILTALGVTRQFPRDIGGFRFSPAQACILEALLKASEGLTLEALLAATHDPAHGDDERDSKVVDVWISKMRPQLEMLGVAISSSYGRRRMDSGSKAALRAALAKADAA